MTPPGPRDVLPFSETHLADFEARHCYDRYWTPQGGARYMTSGEAFVLVGDANDPYFVGSETGGKAAAARQRAAGSDVEKTRDRAETGAHSHVRPPGFDVCRPATDALRAPARRGAAIIARTAVPRG